MEFVKDLGQDRNIWVVGGNTILAPLLDQDMVDCLIVQVAPVLLGEGIPLFTQKEALRRFRLENRPAVPGSLRSWCMAGDNRGRSSPTVFFALHSREGHAILTAERLA